MHRPLRLIASLALVLVAALAAGQYPPPGPTPGELQSPLGRAAAAQRLQAAGQADRKQARAKAAARGDLIRGQTPAGQIFELVGEAADIPLYYITDNQQAAISSGAALIRQMPPDQLDGAGLIAGIWDEGRCRLTHFEFTGRARSLDGAATSRHATHVAGTLIGVGLMDTSRGMAPAAALDSYDWNLDLAEMTERAAAAPVPGARILISNHSYGTIAGWATGAYSGQTAPHWFGHWGLREDEKFGQYSNSASSWDQLCHSAPWYLPVKSAGNDRNNGAPRDGALFFYFDDAWTSATYNPAIHPLADFQHGGYDTLPTISVAKNILTVGAVSDAVSGGQRHPPAAQMTSFSGWGPTDDGRIKPDLVANGVDLLSASSENDVAYASLTGTSMAAPNAAGSALLLQQLHMKLNQGRALRSATLKALLIHTADALGRPGPDYAFGWGLLNVAAAAEILRRQAEAPGAPLVTDAVLNAVPARRAFVWDGLSPIRVTLVWTDPAAPPLLGLNDPSPRLVNDLDLRVEAPDGSIHEPFILNPARPADPATRGDNHRDNVEQILLESPTLTGTYHAVVSHKGSLMGGPQPYSLVISGAAIDDLAVSPADAFAFDGMEGGPFTAEHSTYQLTNLGETPLPWRAAPDVPWLRTEPTTGTLLAGEQATVRIEPGPEAAALPGAVYPSMITFSNLASGAAETRAGELRINRIAHPPFLEDFEASPPLATWWRLSGTADWVTRPTQDFEPPAGARHLVMESGVDGVFSRNELTLTIDLEGRTGVKLKLDARTLQDEPDAPPGPTFEEGADFDGVAISADGRTWHEVLPLRNLEVGYHTYHVDLDAAAAAAGIAYQRRFQIRFNHYDNFRAPGDGLLLDNITITADPPAGEGRTPARGWSRYR